MCMSPVRRSFTESFECRVAEPIHGLEGDGAHHGVAQEGVQNTSDLEAHAPQGLGSCHCLVGVPQASRIRSILALPLVAC